MSPMPENHFSSVSREQVTEAYLKAIRLIDERVAPLLGKATTRVLVQGASKRLQDQYPFLGCLVNRPYTDVVPAMIHEHLSGGSAAQLAVFDMSNDRHSIIFSKLRQRRIIENFCDVIHGSLRF